MSSPAETLTLDLDSCAREPIHIPGAIQPHGVLLAVREPDLVCMQASANAAGVFGCLGSCPVGRTLGEAFGPDFQTQVAAALAAAPLVSPLAVLLDGQPWSVLLHRRDGAAILELERGEHESGAAFARHHRRLQTALAAMRAAGDLPDLYPIIAQTVAALTGFDRVMVYRFDADWHGEVVGEALSSPEVDSYFGLHYPASDIPAQARLLYEKNWLRLIPQAAYVPAPLEPVLNPQTGHPLDLSDAALRSVSPIHLEYLRNMGVGASMSISLLVNGRLWGLVACHHLTAHFVPAVVRATCELFGQAASTEIAAKQEARRLAELAQAHTVQTRFFDLLSREEDVFAALVRYTPQLLEFMRAGGAAVWLDGRCTLLGQTPPRETVESLARFLQTRELAPLLATDHLAAVFPEAAEHRAVASGLLAVRLSRVEPHFVLWFRPETLTTVNWAGNPHKPVEVSGRLHPRHSFAEWQEIVRDHSLPWNEGELAGARELHQALNALVLRRSERLLGLNQELERKNNDLNSFAYIAAHDLREPLRGIHNFSRFLREDCGAQMDADSLRKLDTITALSSRVDYLLEALLHYSNVGRIELKREEAPLDRLVDETLEGLETLLAANHTEVRRPVPLPTVSCDPVLLREVFSNLITNAVKYNSLPEKWVEIGWRQGSPDQGQRGPVIYVRDGGIGIPAKHHEEIFLIFRRLHTREQFGGGDGVGLAIVKNVVERHGGRVWVESEPGQGSTFCFTLR